MFPNHAILSLRQVELYALYTLHTLRNASRAPFFPYLGRIGPYHPPPPPPPPPQAPVLLDPYHSSIVQDGPFTWTSSPAIAPPVPTPPHYPRPRLKIGYVSTAYAGNVVGYLLNRAVELHDRARVEVFCYDLKTISAEQVSEMPRVEHFVEVGTLRWPGTCPHLIILTLAHHTFSVVAL